MKIEIISAHSPEWGDLESTVINVMATFSHLPGEELPFTASPDDANEHGREMFERALAGEFGEIGPYSGPSREEMDAMEFNRKKQALTAKLEESIAPLERARRLGIATEAELSKLERLEVFSVQLMRATSGNLDNIEF